MRPLNLLFDYYTKVSPNPAVLDLCGATARDVPYTHELDDDLTVLINAWARPEYLPLIWEAVQYQTRRPRETWIIQNHPGSRADIPRDFLARIRSGYNTVIVESGLNHGCWFRFILAALSCRTKYVAIYDDDTLSARMALESALTDMLHVPGIYGGRGITFKASREGPRFWHHEVSGWPAGTDAAQQVDFAGHLWVMQTFWLRELISRLPDQLLSAPEPWRECGEDMYVSFVAQQRGIPTFVFGHGGVTCNPRWSSIQAYEMGSHANAMFNMGALEKAEGYLRHFVAEGWRLLRY